MFCVCDIVSDTLQPQQNFICIKMDMIYAVPYNLHTSYCGFLFSANIKLTTICILFLIIMILCVKVFLGRGYPILLFYSFLNYIIRLCLMSFPVALILWNDYEKIPIRTLCNSSLWSLPRCCHFNKHLHTIT